ncbi:MAG: glycosyltransferase family 4 protein [Desulfurococcaceae archaeon]
MTAIGRSLTMKMLQSKNENLVYTVRGDNELHITMLCSYFNFKTGGLEKHVYYLARGLTKHGIKVTLITAYKDPYTSATIPPYEGDNLTIIPLKYYIAPLNNPLLHGLPKVLSKINSDVIHVHDHYFYGSVILSFLKKIIRRPLVLTIHTSKLRYDNFWKNLVSDVYDISVSRTIFKASDKIITVTRTTAYELISRGLPEDKLVYIPNFLTVDSLEEYDEKTYNDIKNSERFKILYVGRLVYRKGLHILLDAFNIALRDCIIPQDSLLMIVGKGPLEVKLRRSVELNPNLKGRIMFWGAVTDSVLGALYRACDVVVLPSLSGETTSLVLQEAILLEKQFIASLVSGVYDYLLDGFWGFYVPPGDVRALAESLGKAYKLLTENQKFIRKKVRENKEKLLKTRSSEHIILRTIQTYYKAINNYAEKYG